MRKREEALSQLVKLLGSLCLLLLGIGVFPIRAAASSGIIQFTTKSQQVTKGDSFAVVCQLSSDEEFLDASFQIEYDDELFTFLYGGSKVSGGFGILTVASTGNETATTRKTFSLQFEAKKKGTGFFGVEGNAQITDADGNAFSVSSNQLTVTVGKKGKKSAAKTTKKPSTVTPEPTTPDSAKGDKSQNAPDAAPDGKSDSPQGENGQAPEPTGKDEATPEASAAPETTAASDETEDFADRSKGYTSATESTSDMENTDDTEDQPEISSILLGILILIVVGVSAAFIMLFCMAMKKRENPPDDLDF